MNSYHCVDMGPNPAGTPERLWEAAQNVPLRGTEAGCLSLTFEIALEGLTPGSLRLHMSPQLGNVLMEDLGSHRGLLGMCLL